MDGDPYRTPGTRMAPPSPPEHCPRCGSKLERIRVRWVCPIGKCGEWLGPDALESVLQMREPKSEFAEILRRSIERAEPWAPAPCPCCGETMQSAVCGRVVLDFCDGHGVWLDRGEREALESTARVAERLR